MLSLSLLALSPAAPSLWHFEGPLAFRAQEWIQSQYGDSLTDHLFDEIALERHLSSLEKDPQLKHLNHLQDCLVSRLDQSATATCDIDRLLLDEAQLGGHVYFYASVQGAEFTVKLLVNQLNQKTVLYEEKATDLKLAGRKVIERAFAMGRYEISGAPSTANIFIDGVKVGQGNGSFVVSTGTHQVKVTAPDFQDYIAQFKVKSGQRFSENIKMASALSILDLKILHKEELQDLKLKVDDQELSEEQYLNAYEMKPGKHRVVITAKDREPIDKEIELAPGEKGALVVNLQYDRPLWKIALNTPHPDTKYGRQQISIRLQSQSIRAGAWSGEVSGFETYPLEKINAQTEKMNGLGFDVSFAWLVREELGLGPMRLDLIGYNFERSGNSKVGEALKLDNSTVMSVQKQHELKSLHRHKFRLGWVGYQLPMWRVTPYIQGGFLWVYERGEISKISTGESGIVTRHGMRFGWELGLDYRITPTWVIKASMTSDVWPGERSAIQSMIGGAFAFDALTSPLLR